MLDMCTSGAVIYDQRQHKRNAGQLTSGCSAVPRPSTASHYRACNAAVIVDLNGGSWPTRASSRNAAEELSAATCSISHSSGSAIRDLAPEKHERESDVPMTRRRGSGRRPGPNGGQSQVGAPKKLDRPAARHQLAAESGPGDGGKYKGDSLSKKVYAG